MNVETVTIRLGSGHSEHIELEIPCEGDESVTSSAFRFARVRVRAGTWTGEFGTILSAQQLVAFRDELRGLHRSLSGTVRLEGAPDEGGLRLALEGDSRGHIAVTVRVAIRSRLKLECEFGFQSDQTYLREIIANLDRVISRMST